MTRFPVLLLATAFACSSSSPAGTATPPDPSGTGRRAVLALADSILGAARVRDADRFASHFAERPGFVYLINRRAIRSTEALRETFASMLSRQRAFEPAWRTRAVDMLSPTVGVFTGEFATRAETAEGEQWSVEGVVTFVALLDGRRWRVVSWHTTE